MEPVKTLFARHGLRCTPQREEIYLALMSTKTHPTVEELFATVRSRRPGISLGTVYNALTAFTRRGLCRRLPALGGGEGRGGARFDADTGLHVHLLTHDGRVRDVPADLGKALLDHLPPELLERIEKRMGTRIDQIRVEFVGTPIDPGAC